MYIHSTIEKDRCFLVKQLLTRWPRVWVDAPTVLAAIASWEMATLRELCNKWGWQGFLGWRTSANPYGTSFFCSPTQTLCNEQCKYRLQHSISHRINACNTHSLSLGTKRSNCKQMLSQTTNTITQEMAEEAQSKYGHVRHKKRDTVGI